MQVHQFGHQQPRQATQMIGLLIRTSDLSVVSLSVLKFRRRYLFWRRDSASKVCCRRFANFGFLSQTDTNELNSCLFFNVSQLTYTRRVPEDRWFAS